MPSQRSFLENYEDKMRSSRTTHTDAQEIYFNLRLHVKGLQILKVKNTSETLMEDRFKWMAITGQQTKISYKNIESHLHLSFCTVSQMRL